MIFHLIGMSDSEPLHLDEPLRALLARGRVFSGGLRHRELVEQLLPVGYRWIPIAPPMTSVFEAYEGEREVIVFSSGDPLFYGFAATVQRLCPQAELRVYPHFNSLQMLAHRLFLPYEQMRAVSLTGRDWAGLDEAVISGEQMIGVLTDKRLHTPARIAERLLDYGYSNYEVYVGELLGNKEQERVTRLSLAEVAESEFAYPNAVILKRTQVRRRPFGIADGDFALLDGRSKMLTKSPIRLVTLAQLQLREARVFWDVGFCTGSVSIEAKLQFPHLQVVAFEKREVCRELFERNSRRWGAVGMQCVIGDFLDADLSLYPRPDAVFIGGHGGRLPEVMARCVSVLPSGGRLVFNSVSEASREVFLQCLSTLPLSETQQLTLSLDSFNPITILQTQVI